MDKQSFLFLVSAIAFFISLFLGLYLLTVKTEHKLSNRLFALFLFLTAIDLSLTLFNPFTKYTMNIGMMATLLIYLQIPTFGLYVKSVCYSDFKLKSRHWLNVIPFLIANLILIPRYYSEGFEAKINFLGHIRSHHETFFNHIFLHLIITVYIIVILVMINRAKKLYLENHAGVSLKSFQWLIQLSLALSVFYFIALLKNIFKFSEYPNISEWLKAGLFVFQLVIVCWYLIKALNHPELFRKIDTQMQLVKEIVSIDKNEDLASETSHESDVKLKRLRLYMEEHQPYLNPSLTIKNVSEEIEIPTRELSLLINHTLGQHFFDFINSYRIKLAKDILSDKSKRDLTVLEILYEVGFNSKSSFNTAFKKHTGTTPTSFRKTLID